MAKRKKRFYVVVCLCLLLTAASAFFSWKLTILVILISIPLLYLANKPLIPTPAPILYLINQLIKPRICPMNAPAPMDVEGGFRKKASEEFEADIYLCADGKEDGDGSREHPFTCFEQVQEAVRKMEKSGRSGITVAVMAGRYETKGMVFKQEDSGTEECPVCYRAFGGEVILDGGIAIPLSSCTAVPEQEVRKRFPHAAGRRLLEADLSAVGLTRQDIGEIHAVGTYHTADQYDGDYIGDAPPELFENGNRMTLARYPKRDSFLQTGKVLFSPGGGNEYEQTGTFAPEGQKERNPESDRYEIDEALADRISSWAEPEKVWMFGYWMYDWADASSPIGAFDRGKRMLSPKFISKWGAREGAPYYFFNIPEELSEPGEYYLDRDSMKLYFIPLEDAEDGIANLSLATEPLIRVQDALHLCFDGITVQNTRGDGIDIKGNSIVFQNGTVRNIGGQGILVEGGHNHIRNCEICSIGKGGVILRGGDRNTLSPAQNNVENNRIHHWSEIYKTYCPAVLLEGVGQACRKNEMFACPHEVIWVNGNNHLIEENRIHDACLLTKDGGAIYTGKHWSYFGTVIRNNRIWNLGKEGYTPCAIYLDDAASGQTVCGNLMVNIPGMAIQLGGGRNLTVKDNIIVNCANAPISYDDRAREGALFDGWFHYCTEKGGLMWQELFSLPWRSKAWQTAYPSMKEYLDDFSRVEEAGFVPNPAGSLVEGNVIVDKLPFSTNSIARSVRRFSTVRKNRTVSFRKATQLFQGFDQGDYRLLGDRKEAKREEAL
ncbi:MAG: right-handed parallel beta-helix repeat-containing protein [Firmicutes bacterium]|nr:right-handed parallel beta-helix repeat-containing protein [Lachnospiraceae bacterium]MBQ7058183.1 right-handed parallel beta-helix repeat-containing protein [Bacillota bacterium]